MQKKPWILAVLLLVFATLACKTISGAGSNVPLPGSGAGDAIATQAAGVLETIAAPTEPGSNSEPDTSEATNSEPTAETQPGAGLPEVKTEFPLPADVSNLMDLGNGSINFQAKISLKDAIAFYRESFIKQGYKEREINTAITDSTFSLVFDGHASGKAIVAQGVDLGSGNVNINIRLEDI